MAGPRFPYWQAQEFETVPEDKPLSWNDNNIIQKQFSQVLKTDVKDPGTHLRISIFPEIMDIPLRILWASKFSESEEKGDDFYRQANQHESR